MSEPTLAHMQRMFAQQVNDDALSNTGFGVYRRSALALRVDALKAIFPVCLRIVGQECFESAARTHVYDAPRGCLLEDEGEGFADIWQDLVTTRRELADYAYLPDLCRLERLRQCAQQVALGAHQYDWSKTTPDVFQHATLMLSQTFFTLETPWPLLSLFGDPQPTSNDTALWVFRDTKTLEIEQGVLSTPHAMLIRCIRNGSRVSELANEGVDPSALHDFVRRGWIIGLNVQKEAHADAHT